MNTCTTKKNAKRSDVWQFFLAQRGAGRRPILMDSSEGFSYVAIPDLEQPATGENLEFLNEGTWVGFLSYDFGLKMVGLKSRHTARLPDFWFQRCGEVYGFEVVEEDGMEFLQKGEFSVQNVKPQLEFLAYEKKLQNIAGKLRDGETYQVNFTFPFRGEFDGDAFFLYASLFAKNPSKRCFFAEEKEWAVCSNSPERLFSLEGGVLSAEPIKGTVGKDRDPQELLNDEKSYAELTMIVDLMRNDFARVSKLGSVKVPQHQAILELKNVWHTYSVVEGELMEDKKISDVLKAVFPGGSITGCPKKRTMQIIDDLEEFSRGAYCGSAGFVSLDGRTDFNIMIRTATVWKEAGLLEFPAGGGIVVDSVAESEYEEVMQKAQVFLGLES